MADIKVIADKADIVAIADEVRTLSDISNEMSLNTMNTKISDANLDISNQTDLIAQIKTALEGKAAGSNTSAVETCTVKISVNSDAPLGKIYYTTIGDNGSIQGVSISPNTTEQSITCICNSIVAMQVSVDLLSISTSNAERLGYMYSSYDRVFFITAPAGGVSTIVITVNTGGSN